MRKIQRPEFFEVPLFLAIALSGSGPTAAAQTPPSTPATLPQDIVLVLDNSGSMRKNDPGFLTKEAVRRFVQDVPDEDRLSLVIFDKQVRATSLGSRDAINLTPLNYRGPFTNIPAAMHRAIQELKLNGRPGAARTIVLLTDGVVDTGNRSQDQKLTQWLREELLGDAEHSGIKIFTIALGTGSDIRLVQELAQRTGGQYVHAPQAKDPLEIFAQLSDRFFTPVAAQAPAKGVPQLAQASPATPPAVAPSNQPQAGAVGDEKASPQLRDPPRGEPEEPKAVRVAKSPAAAPQPSSAVQEPEKLEPPPNVYGFVVVAALVMAAVLALVAAWLWYRERKPRFELDADVPTSMAYLFDLSGVSAHERHELGPVTVIGRVPTAQHNIVINRPEIGRVHAVIERKHHGFWLIDQNSKNGTYVNGHPVNSPICLTHGDHVRFHDFAFEFALAGMSLADATVVVGGDFALSGDSPARSAASHQRDGA